MLVQQILAAKPVSGVATIAPRARVADALTMLAERGIGAVVVAGDDRNLVGILSERDIVRALAGQGAAALALSVEQLMTRQVVTCAPGDTVRQVAERMTTGRFRHMPVIESGAMIGLVSIGDVVKWRLDELAMQRDALEGMIRGH